MNTVTMPGNTTVTQFEPTGYSLHCIMNTYRITLFDNKENEVRLEFEGKTALNKFLDVIGSTMDRKY